MNRRPLSLVVCLLVPFVILVAGLSLAAVQGVRSFRTLLKENGRGPVPPGFVVEIGETGSHTLWLHTYSLHEGKSYESDERLPTGSQLVLTNESTGQDVPLFSSLNSQKNLGSETAVSVGTFEARAGDRIAVQGTGFADAVLLSVAPAKLGEVFGLVLQVGGIAAISFFLSIALLIILLHRRQKAMQAEVQMAHPQ